MRELAVAVPQCLDAPERTLPSMPPLLLATRSLRSGALTRARLGTSLRLGLRLLALHPRQLHPDLLRDTEQEQEDHRQEGLRVATSPIRGGTHLGHLWSLGTRRLSEHTLSYH